MSNDVPRIKKIGHVVLHVEDPAKSAQWYVDVLGMTIVTKLEGGPFQGAVFLTFGEQDHDIALFPGGLPGKKGKEFEHIGLEVECGGDLDVFRRLYDKIVASGAEIAFILDHGVSKGVYFYEPDGHMLEIYCQLVPSGPQSIKQLADNQAMAEPCELGEGTQG